MGKFKQMLQLLQFYKHKTASTSYYDCSNNFTIYISLLHKAVTTVTNSKTYMFTCDFFVTVLKIKL